MNPAASKWVIVTAIALVAIFGIVFFVLHRGYASDLATQKANAAAQISQINHIRDSLQKQIAMRSDTIQTLHLQIDTLDGRYLLLKNMLVTQSHDLNQLRQIYNSLNLNRISGFGSDSISKYFNDNFDSTKIH